MPPGMLPAMNRTEVLSSEEAQHKARAEGYLAEARRILRSLAAERRREANRPAPRSSLLSEVKSILRGN